MGAAERYPSWREPTSLYEMAPQRIEIQLQRQPKRLVTSWLKSRFTKKCRPNILSLYPLATDPRNHQTLTQRHLDTFAMRFLNKSMVPSRVYVVLTGNSADAEARSVVVAAGKCDKVFEQQRWPQMACISVPLDVQWSTGNSMECGTVCSEGHN
ncbi:hypothetical protein M404DRAFT_890555 [Pisolithus tinctorius Marx 270]|uniref:Uncharacterized protein n=1 Tax=Pisolithus tinctorius Marx 270 TaxID=870435 RepID=A0A0C3NQE2_PISTI|nr:hypothetical protein M404DRAFT_890555 [Pisolithus tinctorius Marx 270]